jgi:hypothetical protein
MTARHSSWAAAALYVALTFLLAYPLSVTANRTLPSDDPDGHLFMWTLAWDAHAFVHQPLSIFDANIFYPNRGSLAYSENLIGSAFFAAPVLWVARQQKPFSIAEVPVTTSERYHSNYMLHSMARWQKTVHGFSGIRPLLHQELYDQLRTFPSEDSVRHLAQLDVTYVIVHSSWFSPEERRQVEERLLAFGPWLKLEYTDPDSRVYSIHRPSKEEP